MAKLVCVLHSILISLFCWLSLTCTSPLVTPHFGSCIPTSCSLTHSIYDCNTFHARGFEVTDISNARYFCLVCETLRLSLNKPWVNTNLTPRSPIEQLKSCTYILKIQKPNSILIYWTFFAKSQAYPSHANVGDWNSYLQHLCWLSSMTKSFCVFTLICSPLHLIYLALSGCSAALGAMMLNDALDVLSGVILSSDSTGSLLVPPAQWGHNIFLRGDIRKQQGSAVLALEMFPQDQCFSSASHILASWLLVWTRLRVAIGNAFLPWRAGTPNAKSRWLIRSVSQLLSRTGFIRSPLGAYLTSNVLVFTLFQHTSKIKRKILQSTVINQVVMQSSVHRAKIKYWWLGVEQFHPTLMYQHAQTRPKIL